LVSSLTQKLTNTCSNIASDRTKYISMDDYFLIYAKKVSGGKYNFGGCVSRPVFKALRDIQFFIKGRGNKSWNFLDGSQNPGKINLCREYGGTFKMQEGERTCFVPSIVGGASCASDLDCDGKCIKKIDGTKGACEKAVVLK
jgi:hypothetical protein